MTSSTDTKINQRTTKLFTVARYTQLLNHCMHCVQKCRNWKRLGKKERGKEEFSGK